MQFVVLALTELLRVVSNEVVSYSEGWDGSDDLEPFILAQHFITAEVIHEHSLLDLQPQRQFAHEVSQNAHCVHPFHIVSAGLQASYSLLCVEHVVAVSTSAFFGILG